MIKLTRPILCLDVETTGVDVALDRITSLAMIKTSHDGGRRDGWTALLNPEREIPPEVVELTGITNEAAKQQKPFRDVAKEVMAFLTGCDLIGYNLIQFDVPILYEEFARAGLDWNLDGVSIVDCGTIFKKKEQRTLTAAVKFYTGAEHEGAHDALADVDATLKVLDGQLERYQDLSVMSVEDLAKFSKMDDRCDLAGKIVMKDGHPVYNIGKSKGVRVTDDISFAYWMMGKDFSKNTKAVLQKILDAYLCKSESDNVLF